MILSTDGDKIRKIIFFSRDGMSAYWKKHSKKFTALNSGINSAPLELPRYRLV
ncbi:MULTISPECIES: hypothetical protein [unclassified Apibacter]|uniref:hypothetical protein n=1 Tax=unclassified Apibacter TaxID=2630820 RepID=UPI001368FDF6|nr:MULTISPECIES: hypothetical protein [unclassified Apibacter]